MESSNRYPLGPLTAPPRRARLGRRRLGPFAATLAATALLLLHGCRAESPTLEVAGLDANRELSAHSRQFERAVVEVTPGVHVAIGYGLANSILLEGTDGLVIVDTMESAEAAGPVKEAFDAISDKPVKAIIYTHNHADHTFGAAVMAGDDRPEVLAHALTLERIENVMSVIRPTIYRRSMRQFGTFLPHGALINAGIGPRLVNDHTTTPALLRPTRTFYGESMELELSGIKLKLVRAPGETPDQLFVWLPDKKVLLPGDNFYHSFPNLYAIRGTAYRDVRNWVESLDKMLGFEPEHLIPSHTRPLSGAAAITTALTDYRDAIQFVHDQTVRAMNLGLSPDQAARSVRLPAHLASKPYLREYYGRVDWSVRAVYSGYLGWFGGNASDLSPLAPAQRAARLARLGGGRRQLRRQAAEAAAGGDHRWALELADALLALDASDPEAGEIRASALTSLGESEISANGRNYYLSQAMEARGFEQPRFDISSTPIELLRALPIDGFMRAMAVNLDADSALEEDTVVAFSFPDAGESYTVHLHRGVARVKTGAAQAPDITVTTDSLVWKELLAGRRNPMAALAAGKLAVEGGVVALARFLGHFKAD